MDDDWRLNVPGSRRIDAQRRRPDKGHDAELQHFANAVRGLVPPVMTHQDGVRAAVCCLGLIESARQGTSLDLDPAMWQL